MCQQKDGTNQANLIYDANSKTLSKKYNQKYCSNMNDLCHERKRFFLK